MSAIIPSSLTHQPSASTLARLQQIVVIASIFWTLAWAWWARSWSWLAVLAGALLILFGYAIVLALEFVAVARVNQRDTVPRAGASTLMAAWWKEVRVAPTVFSWRQPFRWMALPDAAVLASPDRSPIVFVHGFVCNRGFWLPWMAECLRSGRAYTSVNLEPVFGSIDDYAQLIDDAVQRAEALSDLPPLVICHSMGGLAVRAWLANTPGALQRIAHVITIATPHHGTWLARFSHVRNGVQMRRRGEWLLALEAKETARELDAPYKHFTCWYSNADNIALPASTGLLQGADNRHLPGMPHVALAFHPRVIRESLALVD